MAKLVLRYSDDEKSIIESVYKFCVGQKESGMKLSLDSMCERTAALTLISRSSAQRIMQERKKAMGRAATAKATSKVSMDDFDQSFVQRTIASMYSVNMYSFSDYFDGIFVSRKKPYIAYVSKLFVFDIKCVLHFILYIILF